MVYETGIIKEMNGEGKIEPKNYVIKRLDRSHLAQIMKLQRLIVRNLSRSDMLASFSRHFMQDHIESHGFILGVFVEDRLIAFRNVYFPSNDDSQWNLGFDLGFDSETRNRVANLQMVCVHPDYRGNSLALKMNRVALHLLRLHKTQNEICATVSPYNVWNIRILLKCGFYIRALKSKYGGKLRYIVHQDLRQPGLCFEDGSVRVPYNDIERLETLLKAGYVGVAIVQDSDPASNLVCDDYHILFKRPIDAATVVPALEILETICIVGGMLEETPQAIACIA